MNSRFCARFAIGFNVFVGGLWMVSFVEQPDLLSGVWVTANAVCVMLNIPAAEFGRVVDK